MPTDPQIIAKTTEPVSYGPVGPSPAMPPQGKKKFPLWIIAISIVVLIVIILASLQRNVTQTPSTDSPGTPTPTLVPAVTRPLSAIATTSAFLEFEQQLDTVTRGIQNAPIDNQSLLPPRIDLPLGF